MAVEYQLHGERNSDIFRFQWHRRSEARIGFMGFMLKRYDVPGVLVTLIPGIQRGWPISFIVLHFLNSNKTEQNVPKYSTPVHIKTKTFIFWLSSYIHLVTIFICSSRTLMLSCALARYRWLKLANVKVSESMLMYNINSGLFSRLVQRYVRSKTHKRRSTFQCLSILNWLNVH